ncbi:MAG: DUF4058 family protein [Chloroflexota bacterium]
MTPIRARHNLYKGINAHLHSLWQAEGGWNGFHSSHIVYLTTALKAELLPLGYTAEIESSLQIRRFDQPIGRPESDVLIFDTDPSRPPSSTQPITSSPAERVLPVPTMLQLGERTEKTHHAIAVRQQAQNEPVAWIELLSPSNKPGGQDAERYREKRLQLLDSGMVFVEIDYLHESAPTFAGSAYYGHQSPTEHEGSHAYRIAVIDPRPDLWEASGRIAEFDVNAPIPTLSIPLNAGDVLAFDFDAPYQKTFEDMLYGLELVDYDELPHHFDRYSEPDRAQILALMIATRNHLQSGDDLESDLEVPQLSLEDALTQWNSAK